MGFFILQVTFFSFKLVAIHFVEVVFAATVFAGTICHFYIIITHNY